MNTMRVPGVTRNSGWRAVDAEIVQARGRARHREQTAADRVTAEQLVQGTAPVMTQGPAGLSDR